MKPPTAVPAPNVVHGILIMLAAVTVFSGVNLFAKLGGEVVPVTQVIWARFTGHMLFALIVFMPRHGIGMVRAARPGTQILRSLMNLCGTIAMFFGLRYLQLAEAVSILFVMPLLIAALSVPLLGERLDVERWIIVAVGFGGVLVILRPGLGVVHPAAVLVFGAAIAVSLYNILTRKVARDDRPETTLVYSTLLGTIAMSAVVPFDWIWPSAYGWSVMVACALCGAVGHWLMILAMQRAPAPILAPYHYTQIIWATIFGVTIFDQIPDLLTYVGATIVIASGLYLSYRETTLRGAAVPR